jgi:hypothetical protein
MRCILRFRIQLISTTELWALPPLYFKAVIVTMLVGLVASAMLDAIAYVWRYFTPKSLVELPIIRSRVCEAADKMINTNQLKVDLIDRIDASDQYVVASFPCRLIAISHRKFRDLTESEASFWTISGRNARIGEFETELASLLHVRRTPKCLDPSEISAGYELDTSSSSPSRRTVKAAVVAQFLTLSSIPPPPGSLLSSSGQDNESLPGAVGSRVCRSSFPSVSTSHSSLASGASSSGHSVSSASPTTSLRLLHQTWPRCIRLSTRAVCTTPWRRLGCLGVFIHFR